MKRALTLPRGSWRRSLGGVGARTPWLVHDAVFVSDYRAAVTALSSSADHFDIFCAGLEAVALRFRGIYEILLKAMAPPMEVIACGGALLHSPAWTQMMADAMGCPVVACTEPEAAARGAALWALEQTGVIGNVSCAARHLRGRRQRRGPNPRQSSTVCSARKVRCTRNCLGTDLMNPDL